MAAAARREAGLYLSITSGYRSDAEQAVLWAANPDPKWVAPPGTSLHRYGTELDLGPAGRLRLAGREQRALRLHSQVRAWEPWHFGYARNTGSASVGYGGGSGDGGSAVPSFVPARFHDAIVRASQRWNVGAALLSAQIYAESNFNPFAQSPAGAQGIAQFMPGTAQSMGLENPFDPEQAIDAQAHLMRDLLRRFGSVPLALAAYNAGAGAVEQYGGIPPFAETRAYVAKILGLLGGAGDLTRRADLRGEARGMTVAPIHMRWRQNGATLEDHHAQHPDQERPARRAPDPEAPRRGRGDVASGVPPGEADGGGAAADPQGVLGARRSANGRGEADPAGGGRVHPGRARGPREPRVVVVDASVIAPALSFDEHLLVDRLRARLERERLAAPALIDLEVASAWRGQVRAGRLSAGRAEAAFSDLAALPLERTPHGPLMGRIWELRDNLTVYDASYVALAEALDTILLTGDARIARAPGIQCEVELLTVE